MKPATIILFLVILVSSFKTAQADDINLFTNDCLHSSIQTFGASNFETDLKKYGFAALYGPDNFGLYTAVARMSSDMGLGCLSYSKDDWMVVYFDVDGSIIFNYRATLTRSDSEITALATDGNSLYLAVTGDFPIHLEFENCDGQISTPQQLTTGVIIIGNYTDGALYTIVDSHPQFGGWQEFRILQIELYSNIYFVGIEGTTTSNDVFTSISRLKPGVDSFTELLLFHGQTQFESNFPTFVFDSTGDYFSTLLLVGLDYNWVNVSTSFSTTAQLVASITSGSPSDFYIGGVDLDISGNLIYAISGNSADATLTLINISQLIDIKPTNVTSYITSVNPSYNYLWTASLSTQNGSVSTSDSLKISRISYSRVDDTEFSGSLAILAQTTAITLYHNGTEGYYPLYLAETEDPHNSKYVIVLVPVALVGGNLGTHMSMNPSTLYNEQTVNGMVNYGKYVVAVGAYSVSEETSSLSLFSYSSSPFTPYKCLAISDTEDNWPSGTVPFIEAFYKVPPPQGHAYVNETSEYILIGSYVYGGLTVGGGSTSNHLKVHDMATFAPDLFPNERDNGAVLYKAKGMATVIPNFGRTPEQGGGFRPGPTIPRSLEAGYFVVGLFPVNASLVISVDNDNCTFDKSFFEAVNDTAIILVHIRCTALSEPSTLFVEPDLGSDLPMCQHTVSGRAAYIIRYSLRSLSGTIYGQCHNITEVQLDLSTADLFDSGVDVANLATDTMYISVSNVGNSTVYSVEMDTGVTEIVRTSTDSNATKFDVLDNILFYSQVTSTGLIVGRIDLMNSSTDEPDPLPISNLVETRRVQMQSQNETMVIVDCTIPDCGTIFRFVFNSTQQIMETWHAEIYSNDFFSIMDIGHASSANLVSNLDLFLITSVCSAPFEVLTFIDGTYYTDDSNYEASVESIGNKDIFTFALDRYNGIFTPMPLQSTFGTVEDDYNNARTITHEYDDGSVDMVVSANFPASTHWSCTSVDETCPSSFLQKPNYLTLTESDSTNSIYYFHLFPKKSTTSSPIPSKTPTMSKSPSSSRSFSNSAPPSPTGTPTNSLTPTRTRTSSRSSSGTPTQSILPVDGPAPMSPIPSLQISRTASMTASMSPTPSTAPSVDVILLDRYYSNPNYDSSGCITVGSGGVSVIGNQDTTTENLVFCINPDDYNPLRPPSVISLSFDSSSNEVPVAFLSPGDEALVQSVQANDFHELGSSVVDVNVINFEGDVQVCFESTSDVDDDSCLGYIDENENPPKWKCEDKCLQEDDNGQICGNTNHFTNFALLLTGPNGGNGCSSSSDYVTGKWWGDLTLTLSLVLLMVFIFICILIIACLLPKRWLWVLYGEEGSRVLVTREAERKTKSIESVGEMHNL